ncbi:putative cytochrome c nitrite reductase c552 subunit [Selenomonas ruminantium subsp. lactilytica TAM6421]|uniref:nitrite reductase (cytochrome; ammonia-forming) n=1 Tax=Selenomonas ruminantium subsp. lactilytica (strain NBRC 103574 / TAM6421) TaxID=927704 RepID=I0GSU1_SELRL|nr:ammonia-forming cytochrome c nitrite reductase subunit c552 [Selenomonas ruminantium]BAL83828.1 putative cytochrome c nitrite reductase c552 subunit [Selenomonas ruminantium subsp. lactilytica TAM6421]
MSKLQKILAGIVAVCVLFFGFVVVRLGATPNDDSVKLAKISHENYAHLGKEAYKEAYPLEYNSFMKNNQGGESPTGYGGSDPGKSYIEMQPEIKENFKGYKFSVQYDVARGHTWAGVDQINSQRIPPQKGNCIVCKSSWMYDKWYKESGWDFASKPFAEATPPYTNKDTVEGTDLYFGCSSCHDPDTMELRVYQQGFVESMALKGIDISKASHNEMRGYVCGQCHNEYYFMAEDGRVRHPFIGGWEPEEQFKWYQTQSEQLGAFKQDWIHPDSKTPMLKAQHPDFEIWTTSVHADAGVTCVDCHMPYMRENGQKYTSHWMTSPLKTVEASCLKCHDESKETLIARVKTIHDNNFKLQRTAGQTVAKAHLAVKAAMDAGATDEQLAPIRLKLREAQWYWDWVAAENGNGFHNPDKCMRISGEAIDLGHQVIEEANALVKGSL